MLACKSSFGRLDPITRTRIRRNALRFRCSREAQSVIAQILRSDPSKLPEGGLESETVQAVFSEGEQPPPLPSASAASGNSLHSSSQGSWCCRLHRGRLCITGNAEP